MPEKTYDELYAAVKAAIAVFDKASDEQDAANVAMHSAQVALTADYTAFIERKYRKD